VHFSITKLIALAGALAGGQVTDNRSDPDSNGYGLVGMFMHSFIGNFRACDSFVPDLARDFPGAFQRGGETLAGFSDFCSSNIGGGSHQGLRVFGQLVRFITDCLCLFVHSFCVSVLLVILNSSLGFDWG
jgi:hypothetical protein